MMTDNQYSDLIEFLAGKFGRIDQRFDGIEGRTTAVEVSLEALRDEVRLVAEGVTTNSRRIDRLESTMNTRFDRFELLLMDHGSRIQALEDR